MCLLNYSDVGVILVTQEGGQSVCRFRLTRYTGQRERDSKAGLSQSFVDLLGRFFFIAVKDSTITNQILKDLDIVPPACPVLVFHFHIRGFHHKDPAPQIDIMEAAMNVLRLADTMLNVEDAVGDTFVRPIAPTTTEIVDCYRGQELCFLCGIGYLKEEEIVYKTLKQYAILLASQVTCSVFLNSTLQGLIYYVRKIFIHCCISKF